MLKRRADIRRIFELLMELTMRISRVLRSPRRRLQLVVAVAGAIYTFCLVQTPSLTFAQLPKAFSTTFHGRNGFFHVMRWLEHVHSPADLDAFLAKMAAFREATRFGTGVNASITIEPTVKFRTGEEIIEHMALIAQWESYTMVSKMVLQWGLIVFLSRAKAMSSKVAVSTVCLAILSLMCAKIAQSCVLEVLRETPSSPSREANRAAFLTVFLGLLFLVRLIAMAIANAAIGRGYQVYFGNVPSRWKDVPRYMGSKDFALSTLFYTVAAVSGIALSAPSMRSLSEAVHHIESAALVVGWGHYVVHVSGLSASPSIEERTKKA